MRESNHSLMINKEKAANALLKGNPPVYFQ
jgi:hypothetical protein